MIGCLSALLCWLVLLQPVQRNLCISNQALRDHVVNHILNFFKEHPDYSAFALSQNDCTAWCEMPDPGCTTDEQCGSCKVCTDGQCIATGSVPCTEIEPCADTTMTCIVDPNDPCQNKCEPAQSEDTGGPGADAGASTDTGTTNGNASSSGGGCAHGGGQQTVPVLLLSLALLTLVFRRRRRVA